MRRLVSRPLSNLVLAGSKSIADVTVAYSSLAKRGVSRHSGHGGKLPMRSGDASCVPARVRSFASRPADPVAGDRTSSSIASMDLDRGRARGVTACVASRPADRRAAPSDPGYARRRRVCDLHSARAVPAPTGAVASARARSRGISSARKPRSKVLILDGNEDAIEEGAVRESVERGVQGHRRISPRSRADRRRRGDADGALREPRTMSMRRTCRTSSCRTALARSRAARGASPSTISGAKSTS